MKPSVEGIVERERVAAVGADDDVALAADAL